MFKLVHYNFFFLNFHLFQTLRPSLNYFLLKISKYCLHFLYLILKIYENNFLEN